MKIFKKGKMLVIGMFVAMLIISGCSSNNNDNNKSEPSGKGEANSAESIEIKVSTEAAGSNIRVYQLEKFNEIMQEETDGQVELSLYPGAQLYGDIEAIQEIAAGSFDAAQTLTGSIANLIPEFNVLDLPFMFKDDEVYRDFLWNTELGEYFLDRMAEHNMMPIAFWDPGDVLLTFGPRVKEAPKSPADLKGINLTDSGSVAWHKAYEALGLTVTSMPVVESIPAIAQGTIDGIAAGYTNWLSVMPEKSDSPAALDLPMKFTWFVTMNKSLFDGLPEETQDAILSAGKKSEEWQYEYIQEFELEAIEELEAQERDWYEIPENEEDEWVELLVPIYKEFEEEYGIEFMKLAYEASGKGLEYWNGFGLGLD